MSFGVTTGKTATTVLPGDGWYPDLAIAEFLEVYRIPAEYAEELTADHVALARMWAWRRLEAWKAEKRAEGFTSLESETFQGEKGGAAKLYKRAVFCHAKALLLQQFPTIERRDSAKNDAKDAPDTANGFFAEADKALAALTGRTFISVEAL